MSFKNRIPVVNLNGTSKQALIDQQLKVYRAARSLETALRDATPHGRDWQTTTEPLFHTSMAQMEHDRTVKIVIGIAEEAEKLALEIEKQGAKP